MHPLDVVDDFTDFRNAPKELGFDSQFPPASIIPSDQVDVF
jgi:hypothetical protein